MRPHTRIYVAGHRGMVGSAVVRQLKTRGYENLILRTHADLDLTDDRAVQAFFETERPEIVFLAAAKVGGILANSKYPAEFIHHNLSIEINVIHAAWRFGVKRLLFLGSSCVYPKDCPQPIREEYLLTGPLEPSNRPYALAKISGIEMCWSYNRQYGVRYLAAMPTNMYGPGDNYDLQTSHVLPALIRKFHEAKVASLTGVAALSPEVTLWGSGKPRREFLYSDDVADACIHLMLSPDAMSGAPAWSNSEPPLINIGCGEDHTIAQVAALVARVVGYEGTVAWDRSKPDGTLQKLLDVSRLNATGWRPRISIEEGIRRAYADFLSNPLGVGRRGQCVG